MGRQWCRQDSVCHCWSRCCCATSVRIVSAFASSTAILGATIPLAVPLLIAGEVSPIGVVVALAISSTIVDVSPFSTNGALVLANAQDVDRDKFYKQILKYSALVVAIGPLLAWAALVLPGWL